MTEIVAITKGQSEFSLLIEFSDSVKGEFNFKDLIHTDHRFQKLKDHNYFMQFEIKKQSLAWPDIDLPSVWLHAKIKQ